MYMQAHLRFFLKERGRIERDSAPQEVIVLNFAF